MRNAIIKLVLALLPALGAAAQDSLPPRRWWVPDGAKLQFAGNIGFLSAGVSYNNRRGNLEGDFLYGYVPASVGGVDIHTISSKLTWFPVRPFPVSGLRVRPLSAGVLVAYTFGKQYFLFAPKNYPYTYYDFPTAMHFGLFVGGDATIAVKSDARHRWGLYYEVGTTDKLLISYVTNHRSLRPSDILSLAIGVRRSW
ncbi:hypothetical protein [Flaviaesturariibacter amylovorans]|uniref:Outer membrane protein beta-barrel domain-containing protein n=1 Tax=Flaviaesturariibacter amylovorans TaxID=1084520 RepID=A0ABP8G9Q4_9BACT